MRTGRNETCPCGSGKKFKACCAEKTARRSSRGLMVLFGAIGLIAAGGVVVALNERDSPQTPVRRTSAPINANRPQPPGPVPPGKVWSVEHGHWHDAAPAAATSSSPVQVESRPAGQPVPQPAGPVPPGKVWSPEHGHWHDVGQQ